MWETLLGWAVLSTVVLMLVGVGVGVRGASPPDLPFAKWCFSVAYLLLLARVGWWVLLDPAARAPRLSALGAFSLFVCLGVSYLFALSWVDTRHSHESGAGRREQ